jgi:glutamate N-acetyltransferase/amino-acid N-acetyltransferase
MSSTQLELTSRAAHLAWLESQARLPPGFRVGTARLAFTPVEMPKAAEMTVTLIALDQPTGRFAALFTRNAFPGAPIRVGRRRLGEATLGAVVVNNKVSNVCAAGGEADSERICEATAALLGITAGQVLPCSTGVIGWKLPVDGMVASLPEAVASLQAASILPAAEGILTTDLFPKIRRADLSHGPILLVRPSCRWVRLKICRRETGGIQLSRYSCTLILSAPAGLPPCSSLNSDREDRPGRLPERRSRIR